MKFHFLFLLLAVFLFISCDELSGLLGEEENGTEKITTAEVIDALKKALDVGVDESVSITSAVNGYFKDEIIKIILPEEALFIQDNVNKIELFQTLGIKSFIDEKLGEVELSMNRSAEEAAKLAGGVFKDAIKKMSISDGVSILYGKNPADSLTTKSSYEEFDSTAATAYLRALTFDSLMVAYSPIVNHALDKDLIGIGLTTNDIWNGIVIKYNEGAIQYNNLIDLTGGITGKTKIKLVEKELDEYVTSKALDGLFLKVSEQEKKIRKNPFEWAVKIIEKVFGFVLEHTNIEEFYELNT
ncbi:DUF4197 domain-containing protein [Bacteroidota bacterium]